MATKSRRMMKKGSANWRIRIEKTPEYSNLPLSYSSLFLPSPTTTYSSSVYVTKTPGTSSWSVVRNPAGSLYSSYPSYYVSKLRTGDWWAPYVIGRRRLYNYNDYYDDYTTKRRRNIRRGRRGGKGKGKRGKKSTRR